MKKSNQEQGFRLSYKFRLYPTPEQAAYFNTNFGCCRYVYNHFLAERIAAYERTRETLRKPIVDEEGRFITDDKGKTVYEDVPNEKYVPGSKPMSFYDTSKALTRLKKENVDEEGHKWLYDADATALVYALRHLDSAYQNFFRRMKQGGNPGFPRFKSRNNSRQSFTVADCKIGENYVVLAKIGKVKARIHREVEGTIVSASISRNAAHQYFISINVKEAEIPSLPAKDNEVGITMGLKKWVTTSDGEVFERPDTEKLRKKLAREQRKLSRKVGAGKGEIPSNNYEKQKLKVARLQNRIANIRSNATHDLTREIVDSYGMIATRDMGAAELVKQDSKATKDLPRKVKRSMNRATADANFAEINRQLAYKALWGGRTFVEVPKDTPTAQVCAACGHKNVVLAQDLRSEWTCPECGAAHDRKYNGAVNVLEAGRDLLAKTEDSFAMKAKKDK